MQIILLERIDKLGTPGAEVSVKRGYARNWLLPQGKAVRATEENRQRVKKEHVQMQARDQAKKAEAEVVREQLNGKEAVLVRAAGESGHLYGSVRTQDIAEAVQQQLRVIVSKKLVAIEEPIRNTGIFAVPLRLHPQVPIAVRINVAPSEDEAKRQALKHDQAQQRQKQQEEAQEEAEALKKQQSKKKAKEQDADPEQSSTEEPTEDSAEKDDDEKSKQTKPSEKGYSKSADDSKEDSKDAIEDAPKADKKSDEKSA